MGGTYKWPSVEDIMAYRKQVRELVVKVIETTPLSLPVTSDHYLVWKQTHHDRRSYLLVFRSGLCFWAWSTRGMFKY